MTENKMEAQEKAKEFIKEYQALVIKYGLDFAHYPVYIPDGAGGFKTVMNVQVVPRPAEDEKKDDFIPKENV